MSSIRDHDNFVISLTETGGYADCVFSYCCPVIAVAQARTNLDGSSRCFNVCCLGHVPSRWLIRTAYGIPGDARDDCMLACLCPCCSANQLLQTTRHYGNPPGAGTVFNSNAFQNPLGVCDCKECINATCCTPCTIGDVALTGLGMPWEMACCCLTPCSLRNLIRYQYRIKGNDLMDELCAPCAYYGASSTLVCCFACIFAPCICPALCPSYVGHLLQLKAEAELLQSGENKRYLLGFQGRGHLEQSTTGSELSSSSVANNPILYRPPNCATVESEMDRSPSK
mmetsp:Transcript_26199/g.38814  ORF Transcript_26199/g.38814 Transcript_26199/m.38814 type:complete len:283 (+) Transcript_26199:38-886(+)